MKKELNEKEREVLSRISKAGPSGVSITQLAADCFRTHGEIHPARANSWVRNSLRRPVALGMIHKTARGRYAPGPGSDAAQQPAPSRPRASRTTEPKPVKDKKSRGATPPQASRLNVLDFGPIAAADVELGDLTVLVGPEAGARNLFLHTLKMALDGPATLGTLREAGSSIDDEPMLIDHLFGEGMHGAWRGEQTAIFLNGKRVSPSAWLGRSSNGGPQPRAVFIPGQRALLFADGYPSPLSKLDASTPAAARLFSQQSGDLLGALDSAAVLAGIDEQAWSLIDKSVYRGGRVTLEKARSRQRLKLVFDNGLELPFMSWTPGQQQLTPLLLGLHPLLSSRKKLDGVDWVLVEAPELGLSPSAVAAWMVLVLDLLWRGYRVVLSTHSHVILEILTALDGTTHWQPLAETFGLPTPGAARKLIEHARTCSCRVYSFDREEKTSQIRAARLSMAQLNPSL